MKRILTKAAVAAFAATTLPLAAGALTQPAAADEYCTYGGICMWSANYRDGTEYDTVQSNAQFSYIGNPDALRYLNDRVSSAENIWTSTYAKIWEHSSYDGRSICIRPATYIGNFPNDNMNDKSSSNKFYSSC